MFHRAKPPLVAAARIAAVGLLASCVAVCTPEPPADDPEPNPFLNPPSTLPDAEPQPGAAPDPVPAPPDPEPAAADPAPVDTPPTPVTTEQPPPVSADPPPAAPPSPEDRAAREAADAALARARAAKSRAAEANSEQLATEENAAAVGAEREGLALYQGAQYREAAARFTEAAAGFDRAAQIAVEQAGVLAEIARRRGAAEASRQAFARLRQQALEAGVGQAIPQRLQEALSRGTSAQGQFAAGELVAAKQTYDEAAGLLQEALAATAAEVEAALRALEALKASVMESVPEATALERRAGDLERQGRLAEAAAAYRQAAAVHEETLRGRAAAAPEVGAGDAVGELLGQYEAAMEQKDLAALKRLWPALEGEQERAIAASFGFARSIQVELDIQSFEVSADSARAVCRRRDEIVTEDGETIRNETQATFTFRRAGGAWVIESIG